MGCASIAKLDRSYVTHVPPVKYADVFSAYPHAAMHHDPY
jgi:hypothetical protein